MREAPLKDFNDKAMRGSGVSRRQVMQRLLGTAGAGIALPGLAAGHPMHDHLASGARSARQCRSPCPRATRRITSPDGSGNLQGMPPAGG